jgi:O-methyltransferase
MFTPAQLAFLLRCLEETERVPGAVVEIGCASGRTTVFLNKYLDELNTVRRYVCIDTFAGFASDDVVFETRRRGKATHMFTGFRINDKEWFDRNLTDNRIQRVSSFRSDIKVFDLASVVPCISMCLIDVDLYQPVKIALSKVMPLLSAGGLVIVDDMIDNTHFDGAREAYRDFTQESHLQEEIVQCKLGVLRAAGSRSHA